MLYKIRSTLTKTMSTMILASAIFLISKTIPGLDLEFRIGLGIIIAVITVVFTKWSKHVLKKFALRIGQLIDSINLIKVFGATIGLFVGMLAGAVSTIPFSTLNEGGPYIIVILSLAAGTIGTSIGYRRGQEIINLIKIKPGEAIAIDSFNNHKVLDTSAIIDGRIFDISVSRFLEGTLIVPTFVIEELQHIADSSDPIRRAKGRRGLDILSKMQKHSEIKVDIIEANISEEKEVDAKLVKLGKKIGASIITNDYNLNKVAELQGLKVLNINELANAVKIMVFPGEAMIITVIKEGKELGQGVGYLEDGTMVVVEDAINEIGNELEVVVTSVFQTAAGRMIFSRKIRTEELVASNPVITNFREVNMYG